MRRSWRLPFNAANRVNVSMPRMALIITDAGLEAIGVTPEGEAEAAVTAEKSVVKNNSHRAKQSDGASMPATASPSSIRPGTKLALLVDLLRASDSATIDEIIAATGWQAHSVRGAISGNLKKKLGITVVSEKQNGRGRVYRITGAA